MALKLLLLLLYILKNESSRILLQGGGGGGYSGGGGGSSGGGMSGGGSYSGGDSGDSSPPTWDYNIFINLTYEWNTALTATATADISASFEHHLIYKAVKPLIKVHKNKYKVKKFYDTTHDKSAIKYSKDSNGSQWREVKLEVTTEYKTKLTNYVKQDAFNSTLKANLNSVAASYGLQFDTIYVRTKEIPNYTGRIVGIVFASIFGLCCLGFCVNYIKTKFTSFYFKQKWSTTPDKWVYNNGMFGKNHEGESTPFINGIYEGYYVQYGRHHTMKSFKLEFFPSNNDVYGYGTDTVGDYKIDGRYSRNTARMYLNKTYTRGTGDLHENLGHTVKIKLEWNNKQHQFEGPWYVKTYRYEGTGKWVIKPQNYKPPTASAPSTTTKCECNANDTNV